MTVICSWIRAAYEFYMPQIYFIAIALIAFLQVKQFLSLFSRLMYHGRKSYWQKAAIQKQSCSDHNYTTKNSLYSNQLLDCLFSFSSLSVASDSVFVFSVSASHRSLQPLLTTSRECNKVLVPVDLLTIAHVWRVFFLPSLRQGLSQRWDV